ncbi:hypothetical protein [Kitasatospora sp. KL5]|uniref:hypothetical protein n=1 Tax=Kitasatospora sp. KL5 TaxID=3425125 RepID=UPI003D6FF800
MNEKEALLRIASLHSDDYDEGRHYCIDCGQSLPCNTLQVIETVGQSLWHAKSADL